MLKCPSCGAVLQYAQSEMVSRCEYCGSNSAVHPAPEIHQLQSQEPNSMVVALPSELFKTRKDTERLDRIVSDTIGPARFKSDNVALEIITFSVRSANKLRQVLLEKGYTILG